MKRALGQLRIIGGEWRSRLIDFDAAAGVRPTPDRVRQTLFDWLTPLLPGSRVLDLFAGSGALGMEALSRGAGQARFIEQGSAQSAAIRRSLAKLGAGDRAETIQADALGWLASAGTRTALHYDIVFLDPPYDSDLLGQALQALPPLLAGTHRIYVEWPKTRLPDWPAGFQLIREKAAGQVSYGLLVHRPAKEAQ